MVDGDNGCTVLPGDLRRGIGGRIIHDDDFIRFTRDARGLMNGLQRAAKARLLVVRRNDE